MNTRIKKLWIKALESGEYVQCRKALLKRGPKGDSFCCLGVLTDLYLQENKSRARSVWGDRSGKKNFKFGQMLDERVRVWAGLKTRNPVILPNESDPLDPLTAITCNDTKGFSFKKIAKILRATNLV